MDIMVEVFAVLMPEIFHASNFKTFIALTLVDDWTPLFLLLLLSLLRTIPGVLSCHCSINENGGWSKTSRRATERINRTTSYSIHTALFTYSTAVQQIRYFLPAWTFEHGCASRQIIFTFLSRINEKGRPREGKKGRDTPLLLPSLPVDLTLQEKRQ